MQKRKGFIPVVILLVAVFGVAAVTAGTVYWVKQGKKKQSNITAQPTLDVGRAQTPALEPSAETVQSKTPAKPSFTMQPPAGWVQPTDILQGADYALAAPSPDRASQTKGFFSNINVIISGHATGYGSFADYQAKYAQDIASTTPGMKIVKTSSTKLNGLDVLIVEATTPKESDGYLVHQVQYLYYISDKLGLAATGSALEDKWSRDGAKITASLATVKILPATPTP